MEVADGIRIDAQPAEHTAALERAVLALHSRAARWGHSAAHPCPAGCDRGAIDAGAFSVVLALTGEIRVDDLVTGLIEIGRFDKAGALCTLSEILDFDAAEPPAAVPLHGPFDVQRSVP